MKCFKVCEKLTKAFIYAQQFLENIHKKLIEVNPLSAMLETMITNRIIVIISDLHDIRSAIVEPMIDLINDQLLLEIEDLIGFLIADQTILK